MNIRPFAKLLVRHPRKVIFAFTRFANVIALFSARIEFFELSKGTKIFPFFEITIK